MKIASVSMRLKAPLTEAMRRQDAYLRCFLSC
jgi:hypothetical protein